MVGGSVGTSSFGWFLGGFGWFLLVEGEFGWFRVVCCFSSYINFVAYRTLNSLRYSWSHVIDWSHSVFLFKTKTARKKMLLPCRLAVWKQLIISYIPPCSMSDKKLLSKENFWKGSHVVQSKQEYCEIFETRCFGEERPKNFLKQLIIHTHRETERNEPKWGDLPVGWRETVGL